MSIYRRVRDKYKKYGTTRRIEETVDDLNEIWHHILVPYMPSHQGEFGKQQNETFIRNIYYLPLI